MKLPPQIYFASGNANKIREFRGMAIDAGLPTEFVATPNPPEVVEDTGTFAGNAMKKARAFQAVLPAGSWVLADDSGLCVDALNDAPGVESAYFAGPQHDGHANLLKLIEVMRDVPDARRGARYVCVLALRDSQGMNTIFEGTCRGQILRAPVGQGGFGYDPIFRPLGMDQTFAELSMEMKNRLSHRFRAFTDLVAYLRG